MADELPDYLKETEKALVKKKEEKPKPAAPKPAAPKAAPAKRAARPAKRAAPASRQQVTVYSGPPKKTINERWEELTQGRFGTVVYIILGFLIALAVNEALKPILVTDTPVVAVFSESMLPSLEKGDLVVVQGGQEIKLGDIVIYDSPIYKYPIIHRVVNIVDSGVTTKGDHNSAADPWTTRLSNIHGKAILRIPYLGWVKVGAYELLGLV